MSFHVKVRAGENPEYSWDNRRPLIGWMINKEKPDIIGIQSVDKNQLVTLLYDLPVYNYIGEGNKGEIDPGVYNPIFYNKNKFDLISKSQFWLSESPDVQDSKGWGSSESTTVTWGKFRNRRSGHIFFVFNANFCNDSSYAKVESARLLLQKIKFIAGNAPVIISGTINATPKDKPYHILTDNYKDFYSFWDSKTVADKLPKDSVYTYNGYSDSIKKTLDYIFVNGYMNVLEYRFYPLKKEGLFISDHYPIMVSLDFNSQIRDKKGRSQALESPANSNQKMLAIPMGEANILN